ncbi:hypothetical protein GGS26DRAFT_410487 [Hypomontagnella submonticulosa]|nr:hypothetical protein GGS26DRAFT_410487 [Hypomontagnella submonticulosa]
MHISPHSKEVDFDDLAFIQAMEEAWSAVMHWLKLMRDTDRDINFATHLKVIMADNIADLASEEKTSQRNEVQFGINQRITADIDGTVQATAEPQGTAKLYTAEPQDTPKFQGSAPPQSTALSQSQSNTQTVVSATAPQGGLIPGPQSGSPIPST